MSLFHLLSVSASGLEAQRRRAEVLTENLANAETTRTSQGGPYRRKDVIFESAKAEQPFQAMFQTELGSGVEGVRVAEVVGELRTTWSSSGQFARTAGPWCRWCPLLDECSEGQAARAVFDA